MKIPFSQKKVNDPDCIQAKKILSKTIMIYLAIQ